MIELQECLNFFSHEIFVDFFYRQNENFQDIHKLNQFLEGNQSSFSMSLKSSILCAILLFRSDALLAIFPIFWITAVRHYFHMHN